MKKMLFILLLSFSSLFAFEDLSSANFDEKVKDKSVILDFYATWWGTCKALGKSLTKYDASKTEDVTIYKIDIEAQNTLKHRFNVIGVPTVIYMKNGKVIAKDLGYKDTETIQTDVKKYFK